MSPAAFNQPRVGRVRIDRRYTAGSPMPSMRALLLTALFAVVPLPAFVQGLSVLHVTGDAARRRPEADAGAAARAAGQRQPGVGAAAPDSDGARRHGGHQARARDLHRGIGPSRRLQWPGVSMDADGGGRGRPRRRHRTDRGQRGGRARHFHRTGHHGGRLARKRSIVPAASLAGQRGGSLVADHARVGIRHRPQGTARHESTCRR